MNLTGKCLCGKVEIELNKAHQSVSVCYCSQCRRWTSGLFFSIFSGDASTFSIKGKAFIKTYALTELARRGFCGSCGTILFWQENETGGYALNAEIFTDLIDNYKIKHHYHLEDKPDYYDLRVIKNAGLDS
jgi:hypothetical protein